MLRTNKNKNDKQSSCRLKDVPDPKDVFYKNGWGDDEDKRVRNKFVLFRVEGYDHTGDNCSMQSNAKNDKYLVEDYQIIKVASEDVFDDFGRFKTTKHEGCSSNGSGYCRGFFRVFVPLKVLSKNTVVRSISMLKIPQSKNEIAYVCTKGYDKKLYYVCFSLNVSLEGQDDDDDDDDDDDNKDDN